MNDFFNDNDNLFDLSEIDEIEELKHRDPVVKEVGDRVVIMDYSSTTHLSGEPLEPDDYEMQMGDNRYFIVIATHQRMTYDSYFKTYKQDLIVVNPENNKQYRINSGHTKIKLK